jgi:FKBP-type peptidyl-prolyl isomerase-like protein
MKISTNCLTTLVPAAPMRLILYLLPCVLLTACLTQPKACQDNPTDPATETFDPSLGVNLANMSRTNIGDYEQDLVVGTGATLSTLSVVEIHYSAWLVNGTLVDQIQDQNYPVDLRTGSTIGLADGMLGMSVGGERLIVSPSELALGACGRGAIPGNSTIVYKVDLLAIDN